MNSQLLAATCRIEPRRLSGMVKLLRDELARKHGKARRLLSGANGSLDLLLWGQKYLPDHFAKKPSLMHRWLAEQLDAMGAARGSKLNVLGPRGGAKSTIASLAFPLRAALLRSETYIWIVSDTRHQACSHLENIKTELTDNARLAEDFPQAAGKGPVWRAGSIVLRNGTTIEAFGTGQRIRGRRRRADRPTLIVCDDLQNDGHIRSAVQRDHSRTWFHGTLLNTGTAETNVINLATALHREALAMELLTKPGWTNRVFKAIERWPNNMSLWNTWEAIYTDVRNPSYKRDAWRLYCSEAAKMNEGAVVLWPEREDLYTLMCMRAESGHSAFEREKQNSPVNPDACEWPESYFDESIWFDAWPDNLRVKTLALDPSKGADAHRGDYSAFVLLGVDRQGTLYVEADMARRPVPQIVADGVELYRKFQPDVFGIEANQFQDLLAGQFAGEFRRQGMLAAQPVPIQNRVNKRVRIRRLGPYLAGRQLRFKSDSPSTRLLVEQLTEFPIASHDDGPDAVEMAIRLAADQMLPAPASDGLGSRLPVG